MRYITCGHRILSTRHGLAAALAISALEVSAAVFSDAPSFLSQFTNPADYSVDDFSSLSPGLILEALLQPTFTASASPGGLLISDGTGYSVNALTTELPNSSLTLDSFPAGVNVVGGEFFLTADDRNLTAGELTLTVTYSDNTFDTRTFASPSAGDLPFWGFVASGGNTISSATLTTSSGGFNAVDNVIVGTVVPEPAGYAIIAGVGLLGFTLWRRVTRQGER